jgi:hypothetical protein
VILYCRATKAVFVGGETRKPRAFLLCGDRKGMRPYDCDGEARAERRTR